MIDPLQAAGRIAAAGLEAQSMRMRVVSENIANANSTGQAKGSEPYARKTITFRAELDRALASSTVRVKEFGTDKAPFRIEYNPGHPAADEHGNVQMPNVDTLIELADMREANRSHEANLQMIKQARSMTAGLIDLIRGV